MFLRMGFRPLLVCSALLALAQAAPAQIKIAVVEYAAGRVCHRRGQRRPMPICRFASSRKGPG